ncbi:hypothetical protein [Leptospira idonii]|uniref:Uncharacterized protein n=1 Tax=Leptospira idonii TaxID=1193500 RepID=A0A4R9M4G4_9LEPT|nr:hypothetical protein [Leptospira idonii]TGN20972.1 hypothetical protein EHS15_00160 [Leptospira idonii]
MSYNADISFILFQDQKDEKQTTFTISKWRTIVLHAKITRHGSFANYFDYLIERYSHRIYQIPSANQDPSTLNREKTSELVRFQCKVCNSSLMELGDLADYCNVTRTKMFRILFEIDLGGDSWPMQVKLAA